MFGRGGTAVEIINDKALALPPLDLQLARDLIERTRVSRILRAYRDVPAMTVSQSSADSLARYHHWRDVAVVPEGHAPHPVPSVPKETTPTVAFLGRLVPMKRPEHAIAAFQVLARDVPSARLWMIGDGPLRARLQASAPENVTFLGRLQRDELLDRLARAHVLVATSVREGWGLNVSEAAMCGTPSIGYAVPGLVDAVPASGGALVESTVPWPEVAEAVERRLERAVRS